MNYYLSALSIFLLQLWRQSVDAKVHIDTNILSSMWKDMHKMLNFDINNSRYDFIKKFSETPEGQKIFDGYKTTPDATDYTDLWRFISKNSADIVASRLIKREGIDSLLKIATIPSNLNNMVVINSAVQAEFFTGNSFKVNKPAKAFTTDEQQIIDTRKKVFEGAPGLEISTKSWPLAGTDTPVQSSNKDDIEPNLKKFWQNVSTGTYPVGSIGDLFQKFYVNTVDQAPSSTKTTIDNYLKAIKNYGDLIKSPFLKGAKLKPLPKALLNLLNKPQNDHSLDTLVKSFTEGNERFDINDLLFLLESSVTSGDKAWTDNIAMLPESLEFSVVQLGLEKAGVKVQIGSNPELDFASIDPTLQHFLNGVMEPYLVEMEKAVKIELAKTTLPDSEQENMINKLVDHLLLSNPNYDLKKFFADVKASTPARCARPATGASRRKKREALECIPEEEERQAPCEAVENCIDHVNIKENNAQASPKEDIKRPWGEKVTHAGSLIFASQLTTDIAQGNIEGLVKDISMVAAPTIIEGAAARVLPIFQKKILPKMLANLEEVTTTYATDEAAIRASKIAENLLEAHSPLKNIPGILGRLTNITRVAS